MCGCFGGGGERVGLSVLGLGCIGHRGSVLGPLLYVVVLGALSGGFGDGLPVGLLCADGLVLIAETGSCCWRGVEGGDKEGLGLGWMLGDEGKVVSGFKLGIPGCGVGEGGDGSIVCVK